MSLKIVFDARRLTDFGIGTYIRNLLQALSRVDYENSYTLIVSPEQARSLSALPANFQTSVYPGSDLEQRDNVALPWFVRRMHADLCHIPLNRVPLLMPRPYVVTIHDMSSLLFEQRPGVSTDLRRFRFRRGLLRAERIIAVSAATRRDVQNILNIRAERVHLVHNAPDPNFFRHHPAVDARAAGPEGEQLDRQRILERYQIKRPFLLYAGRIRPQKNIPRLVEAFAVVRSELENHPLFQDLRLIIIGDEISSHPSVRRAVILSRVERAVRFLGFVPFDTLRVFYEEAAVFVFPSLYEGFGLPPLEAMASGTPVVTSNIGSLLEVAGRGAMLVNPENVFDIARGIREVLLDSDLRVRLIAAGREHAARYSWDRAARAVLEIYRGVGETRSPSG